MKLIKAGGHRLFEQDAETAAIVSAMLVDLEKNGMDAVRRYSQKFDDWSPTSFRLNASEIESAIAEVPKQALEDTDYCQQNVRVFAQAQLKTMLPLEVKIRPGVTLGHRHIPVNAVGSYIPGGRYPMFGSAQMSIIPAKVAGVKHVSACTPPVRGKGYFPATINAIQKAGADSIYILGGVPALALMAFGLDGNPPVDMLCGAGNRFVAEAKRQLFGRCGIDLLAGPTEILIIADHTADPSLVACDLLGQAEHDPNSGICLITTNEELARKTIEEVERQLAVLPTRDVASLSWRDNGIVYLAESREEALSLCNDYAPEHLELHVDDVNSYVDRLTNYGSLFIGEETTVAYGDKTIGTNHILPTSRAARYTGGVWIGKFLKTCTYQRMTEAASVQTGEVTDRQCVLEGMVAHALTARKRVERYSNSVQSK
ncbi:MAG TPA: histidinol dehydrogenase [Edaphobacter sp.]|nr:histidinol dehydrogenase [Edaphobacter sp.]